MSRKSLVPVNLLAGTAAPSTPTLRPGDTYYNTTDGQLYIYTGSAWVASGGSSGTQLIFTGFDGGSAATTVFDLTLDIGAAY